jgi:7,8-dihydropterin-6-yl-methyl-4-(beta-D-ribofuranosyl)aminobenzene 5'-phosphate synthase
MPILTGLKPIFHKGRSKVTLGLIVFILATILFIKNKRIEEASWKENKSEKIKNPGSVKRVKILPLIDYYTSSNDLVGEPGVAYLISTDNINILFDVGYNPKNEHPSPLLRNMRKLGVEISDIDNIVISHNHIDHIGGVKAKKDNTFLLSGAGIKMNGVKAFVPEEMSHSTAETEVTRKPRKMAEGIVTIGTIDRALWLMGITAEQALAINVEGKGLVLIIGCGHQKIDRIVKRTKELFDIPIYGVIGGLHYPVQTSRMKFDMQRMLGTGKLPWQRIGEDEVKETITGLSKLNLRIIGISAHDSCDWTLEKFRDGFKDKYVDVVVGKEIII